ncbi:MAG TPA: cache domain-containing protein [Thermoanaerobaculia bacterium]|nr:cache domain-containing protein [Thermoanaerobaculia bacterium]
MRLLEEFWRNTTRRSFIGVLLFVQAFNFAHYWNSLRAVEETAKMHLEVKLRDAVSVIRSTHRLLQDFRWLDDEVQVRKAVDDLHERLYDSKLNPSYSEDLYVACVDMDGQILVHPNLEELRSRGIENVRAEEFFSEMRSNAMGQGFISSYTWRLDGNEKLLAYELLDLPPWRWYVAMTATQDNLYHAKLRIHILGVGVSIVSFLVIVIAILLAEGRRQEFQASPARSVIQLRKSGD